MMVKMDKISSSVCEMTWFNIPSTFIKIKNYWNFFWNIFVFLSTQIHYIHFHKYTPISHFIKWNEIIFKNILPRLYFNIICKNIVKVFQKFEVGYTQTCISLESGTMWHPKGGHYNVPSPCFHGPFSSAYSIFVHTMSHLKEEEASW
jgi:hypothetical protein